MVMEIDTGKAMTHGTRSREGWNFEEKLEDTRRSGEEFCWLGGKNFELVTSGERWRDRESKKRT